MELRESIDTVRRGVVAGAAGVTALNLATYLDMLVRGRGESSVPERLVDAIADKTGTSIPGKGARRNARRSALGALSGIAVGSAAGVVASAARSGAGRRAPLPVEAVANGALAMALSDVPATALGLTSPRAWSTVDWLADAIPHLAYGAATTATLDAMAGPVGTGTEAAGHSAQGVLRCAALGAATGCRSTLGVLSPGLVSGSRRRGTAAMLIGSEMAFDKVPGIPSRTTPPALVSRAASAAAGSYRVADRFGTAYLPAVVAGVAGSLVGTFGGAAWRQWASARMPDWCAAVLEDAVSGSAAYLAVRPVGPARP